MSSTLLARSWQRCWSAFDSHHDGSDLMHALLTAYGEPQRHYHNLRHLQECVELFERHGGACRAPAEVELALWFHDAIYDVRASDNEARSARWARAALAAHAVPLARIAMVEELILATRHHALPKGDEQALLVDIDLAILGAPPARFAQYEEQIRAEYNWVEDSLFTARRAQILASFLARPCIYQTPAIGRVLEAQARANLSESLRRLRAP